MYLMHFVQWTCQYYIELMVGRVRSLCSRDCIIRIFMVKDHSFTEKKFQISGGERTGKWGNHLLQAFFFQIKDDHSVLSYQRN